MSSLQISKSELNNKAAELNSQLSNWLAPAKPVQYPARAIIAPHAGYTYCGACGGHAYRQIDPTHIKRVFILGPSHHVRLSGCALSATEKYQTPLYDLIIDSNMNEELYATGKFETMKIDTDEDEHSIEMQLPYVAKVMERRQGHFTIIPVLVGSLSTDKEQTYGRIFAKYLADPENLFVISSDFCHWGQRFHYTYYDKSVGDIWQSIEALDRMGMDIIETLNPVQFSDYLKQYHNTICGRYPIGVLLNIVDLKHNDGRFVRGLDDQAVKAIDAIQKNGNGHKMSLKFVKYAQSSQCKSMKDSSVSYASAALVIE